ncbi:MAG: ABC transporter permease [Fervidicoccaceae archaeon]
MKIGTKLSALAKPRNLFPAAILAVVFIFAVFAEFIAPYPPLKTGVGPVLSPPSLTYLMGTDQVGSDIFSQVVYGSRTALYVGFLSGFIGLATALLLGLLSGYYGKMIDMIVMRIVDLFLSIPVFVFMIVLLVVFGSNINNIALILGFFSWPLMTRVVRSQTLSISEKEFVATAKSIGERDLYILFREILPNVWPSVIPLFMMTVSGNIVAESGISFLGLGDPNIASWGKTLAMASRAFYAGSWWGIFFPGLVLTLTIVSLNLISDYIVSILTRTEK